MSSHLPFEFEPEVYHHGSRAAYVGIVARAHSGRRARPSSSLPRLSETLKTIDLKADAWITACEFREWDSIDPKRAAYAPVGWVVLEYGKVPELAALSPEKLVDKVLEHCRAHGIPEPTLIVASGTRLEVKWCYRRAAPSSAFSRWRAVQKQLCASFALFGADSAPRGITAAFRLVGSTDTTNGTVVRVVHCAWSTANNGRAIMALHDFDEFAASVLPYTREQVKKFKKGKAAETKKEAAAMKSRRNLKWKGSQQLVSARLNDLKLLVQMRQLDKPTAPLDQREMVACLGASLLSRQAAGDELREGVATLADELELEWSFDEVERRLVAVMSAGLSALKNEAVIAMLGITADEQRTLSTLIGKEELQRRHREREGARRRRRGIPTLDEKRKMAADRREKARAMKAAGMGYREIQRCCGYPSADAARVDLTRS